MSSPRNRERNRPQWQVGLWVRARRRSHRQCAQLAGPDIFDRRRWGLEHELNLPAKEVSERRRRPAIRYVQHVDASHHLEQLAGDVLGSSVAGRSHIDLAWVGPCVGNKVGEGLGWNRGIDLNNKRHPTDARYRGDIPQEVEFEILI